MSIQQSSADTEPSPRIPLRGLHRVAQWDLERGLFVSTLHRAFPLQLAPPSSTKLSDYQTPRILNDRNIYLAFYPRKHIEYGALFSPLDLSDFEINQAIHHDAESDTYHFAYGFDQDWALLEDLLIRFSTTLIRDYSDAAMVPHLVYPAMPGDFGYRSVHKDRRTAHDAVKQSREAFYLLSALATFALSLWLGNCQEDCLVRAFNHLATLPVRPISYAHLHDLQESVVCDFSPSLRTGGVLMAQSTFWGRAMLGFTGAGASFWLIWGKEGSYARAWVQEDEMWTWFHPPLAFLLYAKERAGIHPRDSRNQSYAPSAEPNAGPTPPHRPPPPPNTDNWACNEDPASTKERRAGLPGGPGQLKGENWEDFFARMTRGLQERLANETAVQQQRRLSHEREAKSGYTKKAKVFVWAPREDDPLFLVRTASDDREFDWMETTEHQRFFWPHKNEWDLCPHLPKFPPGTAATEEVDATLIDDPDDPNFNLLYSKLPKPRLLDVIRNGAIAADAAYVPLPIDIAQHFRERHGFDLSGPARWDDGIHVTHKNNLAKQSFQFAASYFGFPGDGQASLQLRQNVVNAHNTLVAASVNPAICQSLPTWSDLCPSPAAPRLHVGANALRWLVVTATTGQRQLLQMSLKSSSTSDDLYILQPPMEYENDVEWFVATTDPTTVVFIYRKGWASTREIALGLVEHGIPFRRVVKREKVETGPTRWSRGLGFRPERFQGSADDYLAYQRAAIGVLRGRFGGAIRVRGGIAGRLAADFVDDAAILSGPHVCDEIVGQDAQGNTYVDDYIPAEVLAIVCGSYSVEVKKDTYANLSWWPDQSVWRSSGMDLDRWSPNAEVWYQSRLPKIRNYPVELPSASSWKNNMKKFRTRSMQLLGGAQRLASVFLAQSG